MDILQEILSALEQEPSVMLATIISTTGSTPASTFSKMLVKQGGIVSVGTVGGGCMEGDVLVNANRLYDSGKAEILTFSLNEDDVKHGLICGGSLDVLIEPVTRGQLPVIQELKRLNEDGEDCVLATKLDRLGRVVQKEIFRWASDNSPYAEVRWYSEPHQSQIPNPQSDIADSLVLSHRRQQTQRIASEDGEIILEPLRGSPGLIIFGGGHVSKFVARTAAMAGFRVTVVDDREKYANSVRFPDASRTFVSNFEGAFDLLDVKASTYILIVTRGHEYDEQVLEKALNTPAKYIGMIGSKRKVLTAYRHLIEHGVSVELLRRVHAPVGIEIGSVTAEEIAVSIVAQLIHVRREGSGFLHDKSEDMKDQLHLMEHKPSIA